MGPDPAGPASAAGGRRPNRSTTVLPPSLPHLPPHPSPPLTRRRASTHSQGTGAGADKALEVIPVSGVALAASLIPASAPTAGGREADPVLPGGGSALQRELDDDVSRVSAHHDSALQQPLPLARDAVAILVRAHCPSGRVTLRGHK
jgi:hypothetical protein